MYQYINTVMMKDIYIITCTYQYINPVMINDTYISTCTYQYINPVMMRHIHKYMYMHTNILTL